MTGYADSKHLAVAWKGGFLRVRVDYWAKPIALRGFDYEATDDERYDGPGNPIGHGATEAEAVADLLSQIEEHPAYDESVRRTREPYTRATGE